MCTSICLPRRLSHLYILCNFKDRRDFSGWRSSVGSLFNNGVMEAAVSHCETWQLSPAASQMKTCCKEKSDEIAAAVVPFVFTSKHATLNRNV